MTIFCHFLTKKRHFFAFFGTPRTPRAKPHFWRILHFGCASGPPARSEVFSLSGDPSDTDVSITPFGVATPWAPSSLHQIGSVTDIRGLAERSETCYFNFILIIFLYL